jgi:hypothetical protein
LSIKAGSAGRFSTGVSVSLSLIVRSGSAGRLATGAKVIGIAIIRAGNAGRLSTGAGQLDSITCCEITLANIILLRGDINRILKRLEKNDEDHAYIIRLLRILDSDIRRAPTTNPTLAPIKTGSITRAPDYNRKDKPKGWE